MFLPVDVLECARELYLTSFGPLITAPSGAGDKFVPPWGQEPLHRIINGLAPPVKRYVLKYSSALASGSE